MTKIYALFVTGLFILAQTYGFSFTHAQRVKLSNSDAQILSQSTSRPQAHRTRSIIFLHK